MRCKTISLFASTVSLAAFLTIALRWRGATNVWESLYILPATMGVGLLNSSQFIGLSAALQRSQLATTISTFFLSQHLGTMVRAATSAALLKSMFRSGLVRSVGDDHAGSEQVGAPNNRAFKLQLTGQLAYKNILSDTRIAPSLPQVLQEGVLSSYIHGFFGIAGKSSR